MELLQEGNIIEIKEEQYLVIKTTSGGGGYGHGAHDVYPNGHHVFCRKVVNNIVTEEEIDFYQTGFFINMIKDPKIISKAKIKYEIIKEF